MPSQIRKVLYRCTHEIPDHKFQNPDKGTVLKRLKRAISFTQTIRTPSMELCPYCERLRLEEENARPNAPWRSQTGPAPQQDTRAGRRSNTVVEPPMVPQTADPEPFPVLPAHDPYTGLGLPYDPLSWERFRAESDARDMEERVRESLTEETPAEREKRHRKMLSLHLDMKRQLEEGGTKLDKFLEDRAGNEPPGPQERLANPNLMLRLEAAKKRREQKMHSGMEFL
ncbi:hypothetical protein NHQ30_001072 [Ciborinia camelliae]|nr:hypothetical protein NHQ30_001072 [Ciborinia camelliae]